MCAKEKRTEEGGFLWKYVIDETLPIKKKKIVVREYSDEDDEGEEKKD